MAGDFPSRQPSCLREKLCERPKHLASGSFWTQLYFSQSHDAGSNCTLRFLSFKTGAVKIIATIPHLIDGGLSVSPDGRYAVYTQEDQEPGSDLMLVENFR